MPKIKKIHHPLFCSPDFTPDMILTRSFENLQIEKLEIKLKRK